MTHDEIINSLGGPKVVAEHIGVHRTTVWQWMTRGIPPRHWPAILRLCRNHRVRVSLDHLEETYPLTARAA